MAKIRELFVKEIDRRINGVIKADSQEEKEFKEEIDEYVIIRYFQFNVSTFK